jgi:UDP-2,4-diacetamido-2,4,6-trideoxy-beta-L-altropyranose hydrolase
MRSATLGAELVRRGWEAILATRDLPPAMARHLADGGISVLPLSDDVPLGQEPDVLGEQLAIPRAERAIVVVADHYEVDAAWHRRAPWATAVAAIDDLAERPQDVRLLLNQNLGATAARYANLVPVEAEMLLGPRYALVRPEFERPMGVDAARDGLRGPMPRVLVMLGGADEPDVTRRAATAADGLGYRVEVVTGPAYPHADQLRAWAERHSNVTLHANTQHVAELMTAADLCVGAAGSASWERCAVGLPAILVTLAQNQVEVAALLERAGAAVSLGWHEDITDMDLAAVLRDLITDPGRIRAMSSAAAAITDGRGTTRVADALERVVGTRAGATDRRTP